MSLAHLMRRPPAPPQPFESQSISLENAAQSPRVKSRKDAAEEGKYTLLSCLVCAQHRRIDLTGFSWINAQGTLGRGGQAVVAQTRASIDTVFAFKRRRPPEQGYLNRGAAAAKDHAFREICSEIMALGHEDLRRHENIVQLIAISWEIENVKDWKFKDHVVVWPVMILEKADLGDLGHYLRGDDGVKTCLATRLRMCAGIASALAVVHKNGIVHGDIKPENALVFRGDVVKLSDFGFSALASSKSIELGGTYPWRAPELASLDGASLQQAKLTDLYSFGVLCLWVIFRNKLAERESDVKSPRRGCWTPVSLLSSLNSTLSWLSSIWADSPARAPPVPDLEILRQCNTANEKTNKMLTLAHDLVKELDVPEELNRSEVEIRGYLDQLFARLFKFEASSRALQDTATAFGLISQRLLELSSNGETEPFDSIDASQNANPPNPGGFPKARDFQLSKSLDSLCHADFRVRKHIFDCLVQEYNEADDHDSTKAMAAVQLAFCKEVGFGDTRDSAAAAAYREVGQIEAAQLQNMIDATRMGREPFNATLRTMCHSGIIQPIHYGTDFRSTSSPEVLEEMQRAREAEIDRMEPALGKTHPAILNLKWSLSTLLMDSNSRLGPLKHLRKMMQDLEADPDRGPSHRDYLITRAYFCDSLERLETAQTAETILDYAMQTYTAVVDGGLADHVVALWLCVMISDLLVDLGRSQTSMYYLELARTGTEAKFGDEHVNTVMLLDKKTNHLMREGKPADALAISTEISKRIDGLVDSNDGTKAYLRRKGATLFAVAGHFNEALALIEDDFKAMKDLGVPEGDPAYFGGFMMKATVLLELGRFQEAAQCTQPVIQFLQSMPWPPPPPPPYLPDGGPQDEGTTAAEELAALLGKDEIAMPEGSAVAPSLLQEPSPDKPPVFSPDIFPMDPDLLMAEAVLAASLHAWAHELTAPEKVVEGPAAHEPPAVLSRRADDGLRRLLRSLGEKLEGDDVGLAAASDAAARAGLSPAEASCRASSAILRAMDMSLSPLVELVTMLGMRNARGGLHYDEALGAARELGLRRIGDMLAEHRVLCADNEPGAGAAGTGFESSADLAGWATGEWTGTYLYEAGSERMDPTGRKIITLEATPAGISAKGGSGGSDVGADEGWDVDVRGTSTDDMGKWFVKGRASVRGKMVLRLYHEEGSEEEGWEYTGYANPNKRRAFGGYWGMRSAKRESSGGTFLFYKYP